MTDDDKTENTPDRSLRRKARPRWILMSIAGALVLVVGGMTWSAVAYSKRSWDGDKIERFVEWKIDGMLDEVDATDEQREQVRTITTAALADMEEFRDFKREGRQALVEALTQEAVDREALEALRQNKLAAADRASQRLLAALADAAEVLTPAQRAELAEEWSSREWRRWHD
ncbi:MAG: periplasmic heavy metal sensor [Rhodospirillales bacterium]|nr:periplasmic heavy metal sensor [Rhodospirillales bacterium]